MMRITREYLPAILSAVLALGVFAISIGGTYIYDDVEVLQEDARLSDLSRWGQYWTQSYNGGPDNVYRPLTSTSYATLWLIVGDRPWVQHLVNVLLHAGVSACVAELARRLLGLRAGFVAGLLFASHPIHTEAVANIVGRAELMCALGIFGAMILMLRPMTVRRALAITGCFLLAVLSKEQGMLLPPMLLVLALCKRDRIATAENRKGFAILTLLLCWLFAAYIVGRESILPFWWDRRFLDWTLNPMVVSQYNPFGGSVGANRWLMPLVLLGRYIALLIAPIHLSPDYGSKVIGWHVNPGNPYLYLGIAAVIGWCILMTIAIVRRNGVVIFTGLCMAMTYGMIGNIVALIGTNFGERLVYLPSAFLLILLAGGVATVPRKALIGIMSTILVLASLRTVTYAARWNDALEFYRTCVAEQPDSIRLRILLMNEYKKLGRLDEAKAAAAEARRVLPEYQLIWVLSGSIALDRGEIDEAEEYLVQARELNPDARVSGWMAEVQKRRAATRASQ